MSEDMYIFDLPQQMGWTLYISHTRYLLLLHYLSSVYKSHLQASTFEYLVLSVNDYSTRISKETQDGIQDGVQYSSTDSSMFLFLSYLFLVEIPEVSNVMNSNMKSNGTLLQNNTWTG